MSDFLGMALEKEITVAYGDFVDGVKAQADLSNIRAMIKSGASYCSRDIMAVLGIEVEEDGREQNVG